ncbi:ATP-binding protein [Nocardiopsis sediminis]|uniref:ATP-binding protein n=1 Tax=Nocardiopsis sediminis TaxID=1778267 RepID=A0ABV8FK27_9ACTN
MGVQRFTKRFAGVPDSIAEARHWLAGLFPPGSGDAGPPPESRSNAVLLLSEVATNAVRYTASGGCDGAFTVRVHLSPATLRVQVEDGGSATSTPRRMAAGPGDERGRGLVLVDAIADLWGPLVDPPGMFFDLSWAPVTRNGAGRGAGPGACVRRNTGPGRP